MKGKDSRGRAGAERGNALKGEKRRGGKGTTRRREEKDKDGMRRVFQRCIKARQPWVRRSGSSVFYYEVTLPHEARRKWKGNPLTGNFTHKLSHPTHPWRFFGFFSFFLLANVPRPWYGFGGVLYGNLYSVTTYSAQEAAGQDICRLSCVYKLSPVVICRLLSYVHQSCRLVG